MSLLDAAAISRELSTLPGWNGDSGRIARTVYLARPQADALRVKVMGVADEIDHHPLVEHHGNALTFILWTHSGGGVTARDFELARLIEEVIATNDPAEA
ncbi:MAG: 4a-hydroxytetrahydrobiopterin dehydratase [Actinomycetota bacterium]